MAKKSFDFWDYVNYGSAVTLNAAQIGGGVALTVFSGGLASVAGGSLISSGLSTTILTTRSFFNGDQLNADEYIKQAAIGATTGLVSAGMGGIASGLVSNAASSATSAIVTNLAQKAVVNAAVGVGGNVAHGAADAVFHGDSRRFVDSVQPTRLIASAAGGVIASGLSSSVSSSITSRMVEQADDVAIVVTRTAMSNAYEVTVKSVASGVGGAAGAGASTVATNIIFEKPLMDNVGEAMVISAVSGVANGAASAGKEIVARNERNKILLQQKQAKEEEARQIQLVEDARKKEEAIKISLAEAKAKADAVEAEKTATENNKRAELERNRELQEQIESTRLSHEKEQQRLTAEAEKIAADAAQEIENHRLKKVIEEQHKKIELRKQEEAAATQKRAQAEAEANRLQAEIAKKQQKIEQERIALAAAEAKIVKENEAVQALQQQKQQAEAAARQKQQEARNAEAKIRELERLESLRQQEQSRQNDMRQVEAERNEVLNRKEPQKPGGLRKLGGDIARTWKKALHDFNAEKTRALDNIQRKAGPLSHDIDNIRRELAHAETTIRELGVAVDNVASVALKPLRDLRNQANIEADKFTRQAGKVAKDIEHHASTALKPARDLRDGLSHAVDITAKEINNGVTKVAEHTATVLKPATELVAAATKESLNAIEMVKATYSQLGEQTEHILKTANQANAQIVHTIKKGGEAVEQAAKQLERHTIEKLNPIIKTADTLQQQATQAVQHVVEVSKELDGIGQIVKPITSAAHQAQKEVIKINNLAHEATTKLTKTIAEGTLNTAKAIADGSVQIASGSNPHKVIDGLKNAIITSGEQITNNIKAAVKTGHNLTKGLQHAGDQVTRELNQTGLNISKTYHKAGHDISAEWKRLPPDAQKAIIIVAAVAVGYGACCLVGPAIGELSLGILVESSSGTVAVNVLTYTAVGGIQVGPALGGIATASVAVNEYNKQHQAGKDNLQLNNALNRYEENRSTSVPVKAPEPIVPTIPNMNEKTAHVGQSSSEPSAISAPIKSSNPSASIEPSAISAPIKSSNPSASIEPIKSVVILEKTPHPPSNSPANTIPTAVESTNEKLEKPDFMGVDRLGNHQQNPILLPAEAHNEMLVSKGPATKQDATDRLRALNHIDNAAPDATGKGRQDKKNYNSTYSDMVRNKQTADLMRPVAPHSKTAVVIDTIGLINDTLKMYIDMQNSHNNMLITNFGECADTPTNPVIMHPASVRAYQAKIYAENIACATEQEKLITREWKNRVEKLHSLTGNDYSEDMQKILRFSKDKRIECEKDIDHHITNLEQKFSISAVTKGK